jgi:hypothetical protein
MNINIELKDGFYYSSWIDGHGRLIDGYGYTVEHSLTDFIRRYNIICDGKIFGVSK